MQKAKRKKRKNKLTNTLGSSLTNNIYYPWKLDTFMALIRTETFHLRRNFTHSKKNCDKNKKQNSICLLQ